MSALMPREGRDQHLRGDNGPPPDATWPTSSRIGVPLQYDEEGGDEEATDAP